MVAADTVMRELERRWYVHVGEDSEAGFLQSHHDGDDLTFSRDPQLLANENVVPRDSHLPGGHTDRGPAACADAQGAGFAGGWLACRATLRADGRGVGCARAEYGHGGAKRNGTHQDQD